MATFGVLLSSDNGRSWGWVCEMAVGYQSSENPTLGITQTNNLLASTFEGLATTPDRGCTWTLPTAGLSDNVVDLVVEKSDPHSAYALTSKYTGQDDAGSTYDIRVWVTHDDGTTFTQVGPSLDQDIIPQTIDVAPSDGTRVYVSGTRRIGGVAYGALLSSTDGAQAFAELDVPLETSDAGLVDRAPYVTQVDPTNPNRVYVRMDNIDGTRLLVSDDGLASVRQVWQARGDLAGFALSADGTKVYVGGPNDGLYVTTSTALSFTKPVWPGQLQCLAVQTDRILACSTEASGFTVGASTDDGATWTPLLHLNCIDGPVACAASSLVTTQCAPYWATTIQDQLGGACTYEAGIEDAGPVADSGRPAAPESPAKSAGGGCSASTTESARAPATVGLAALTALLTVAARRRKKR
jgi:MYXO-CTERM domain-containing protein